MAYPEALLEIDPRTSRGSSARQLPHCCVEDHELALLLYETYLAVGGDVSEQAPRPPDVKASDSTRTAETVEDSAEIQALLARRDALRAKKAALALELTAVKASVTAAAEQAANGAEQRLATERAAAAELRGLKAAAAKKSAQCAQWQRRLSERDAEIAELQVQQTVAE
eukprot:SAG31_NODE_12631_length_928_cov_1.285887_1_plen_169_part_00